MKKLGYYNFGGDKVFVNTRADVQLFADAQKRECGVYATRHHDKPYIYAFMHDGSLVHIPITEFPNLGAIYQSCATLVNGTDDDYEGITIDQSEKIQ